jgi:hypothetical protein
MLPAFDRASLEAVVHAFGGATPVPLRQAWLPNPSPAFAPGTVRMGWRADTVFVFAELEDADVFTHATDHNQRFWELGDTFEMFFRPADQGAYVEFHVAPNNRRLQLRFADASWMTREPPVDPFPSVVVPGELFRSNVWVSAPGRTWHVLAEIPAVSVRAGTGPLDGAAWAFSFGRYDHTRGSSDPVLSSTSPHAVAAFHRQHEWGTARFVIVPESIDRRRRQTSSAE